MTIGQEIEIEAEVLGADREKVLLLDDHGDDLETLAALLRGHDYEIVATTSGGEALDRLRAEEFAVALLDLPILDADGSPTTSAILECLAARRIPKIFLSRGMPDPKAVTRAYALGALDYLAKPPDPSALVAKVEVLVGLSRKTRELVRRVLRDEAWAATERRERHVLETHLELKRRAIDEAPIGIGFATLDGTWIHVNDLLITISGMPVDQLMHRSLRHLVHRDEEPALSTAIHGVVTGKEARHHGEYRFVHADGSVVWTSITISLLGGDSQPIQLVLVEDITARKQLALALEASEVRFARLQESGLLAVAHEDEAGVVTQANDAFLDLTGYSREDLSAGRIDAQTLTPAECVEVVARANAELRDHGVSRTYEQEFVRKDDTRVAVLCGAAVLGGRRGAVVFALDISQRKTIEIERARLLRELEDSVHARDAFLSLAAHELRHPLTPLLVQVTNLRAMVTLDNAPFPLPFLQWVNRQLDPVERSVRRLKNLIEMLLAVSRMTVGRFRPELEDTDLSAVVRETVEDMRFEIERTGSMVRLHADVPIVGRWDRTSVEQVVTNLVSNALKYGGGRPIEVETSGDVEWGRVSVLDHGIGIAADDRARIFERFERVAPLRHFGGLGLGLWMVREIVDAHRGQLQLWSEPGEGARFTVELPRLPLTASAST